jgi:predicted permease
VTAPPRPPRIAQWLVEHIVPSDKRDDASGDLIELFHGDTAAHGSRRAVSRYWRNAISSSIRFGVERCRNLFGGGVMPTGWRMDLVLAARMLVRHPALSAIGVFGIAVAIAIVATMVTIVGQQFNPSDLPLPQGDRIIALQNWDAAKYQLEPLGPQDVVTWREQLSNLRDIGAFRTVTKNLIAPPAASEPVDVAEMSATGFAVAATPPLMGRVIGADDERPGAAPVVVIGHAEWRARFGDDPNVINTTVQLGDTHYTIVGVMPEGFAFPLNHTYWIPLRLDAFGRANVGPTLFAFGRLADGATLQSANVELTAVGQRMRAGSANTRQGVGPRAVLYAQQFSALEQPANRLGLQLAVFFVTMLLVVISINISVLVYARTAARHAEIAVRTALGASRGRIVAQLFGEGLVLAGLGALAGLALAAVALVQLREGLSEGEALPFWYHFNLSADTMAVMVALTVAAAAVIGALPAWKVTGPRIQNRLQALTAGGGGGMHLGRVWTALILMQVAFAVALLPMVVVRTSELALGAMAGYGFAANEFVAAQLSMEQATAGTFARRFREMEERVAGTGAVRATTFSSFAPGFEPPALVQSDIGPTDANVDVNRVAVNFFDTYGVSLMTGRSFTSDDARPEARAVVVNRSFADVVSNHGAVLGSRIRLASGAEGAPALSGLTTDWYEIVGVVEDFPALTFGDGEPEPKVYRAITPEATQTLTMSLRLHAADRQPWETRLRHIAAALDPTLQVTNVTPMDDLIWEQQRSMGLLAGVLVTMTLSVLLLSAAGIYAMMAFSVTQRRREIGIRLALGAGARGILWTMFSRAAAQLLGGAALGTAVALLLNRAADGELMKDYEAPAIGAVVLLVTIVGLLAAFGPARRGLRIEPTEALRDATR